MPKIMGMPTRKLTIKDSVRQETAYWTPIEMDGKTIVLVNRDVDNETYRAVRDVIAKRLDREAR